MDLKAVTYTQVVIFTQIKIHNDSHQAFPKEKETRNTEHIHKKRLGEEMKPVKSLVTVEIK